jgi:hypothetical protein
MLPLLPASQAPSADDPHAVASGQGLGGAMVEAVAILLFFAAAAGSALSAP